MIQGIPIEQSNQKIMETDQIPNTNSAQNYLPWLSSMPGLPKETEQNLVPHMSNVSVACVPKFISYISSCHRIYKKWK